LGFFALGTAPALIIAGFAANAVKGRFGLLLKQFAGVLVVVMGIWSVSNALTLSGLTGAPPARTPQELAVVDRNVTLEDGVQLIRLRLIEQPPYYAPSDRFTVEVGKPVRIEVDGRGYGCRTFFQIPKFGIRVPLDKEVTRVEFTPTEPGTAVFSCAMGMYRGAIDIVNR